MSFRAITDALPINISHVSIYKWVIKFGSLPFSFCSAFLLSADETVILSKIESITSGSLSIGIL